MFQPTAVEANKVTLFGAYMSFGRILEVTRDGFVRTVATRCDQCVKRNAECWLGVGGPCLYCKVAKSGCSKTMKDVIPAPIPGHRTMPTRGKINHDWLAMTGDERLAICQAVNEGNGFPEPVTYNTRVKAPESERVSEVVEAARGKTRSSVRPSVGGGTVVTRRAGTVQGQTVSAYRVGGQRI